MVLFYAVVAFIYGTLFSSFFTLVGYRVPLNISVVKPNSQCFNCGHRLHYMDLIPILSYFLRKGKCKYCGIKYGSFHVIMEISVGLLFFIGTYLYIDNLYKMGAFFILIMCLVVTYVSLKEHGYVITEFIVVYLMMIMTFFYSDTIVVLDAVLFLLSIVLIIILPIESKVFTKKFKTKLLYFNILFVMVLVAYDLIINTFG